jgi:hypothetical protein
VRRVSQPGKLFVGIVFVLIGLPLGAFLLFLLFVLIQIFDVVFEDQQIRAFVPVQLDAVFIVPAGQAPSACGNPSASCNRSFRRWSAPVGSSFWVVLAHAYAYADAQVAVVARRGGPADDGILSL